MKQNNFDLNKPVSSSFRGDIQGLRAIAVLAVVIFHLGPSRLPGGYIGVDIFFVISGYLIIGNIWRDLNNGSFKLAQFYSKRVTRLFPAFFVMAIATSIAAYFSLLPSETISYLKSFISSLFYISNYFFYFETDYFNTTSHLSPLLHTWSLSVEEQFYIIFPLILVFIFRRKPQIILSGLIVTGLLSLIFSEVLLQTDNSASFYFSPSRFWQFIVGGIIAIRFKTLKINVFISNLMATTGLGVIFFCLFSFTDTTAFPGLSAILPTLATALIILSGNTENHVRTVLSSQVPRFLGDISYSVYLWHWPLIVFYKLFVVTDPSLAEKALILILSILAGYFSWKYIEQYKWGEVLGKKAIKPLIISLFISIVSSIVALYSMDGLPSRYTAKQTAYASYLEYRRPGTCFAAHSKEDSSGFNKDLCINNTKDKPNTIIIGDSHAAHWYRPFYELLNETENISLVAKSGCRPTVSYSGDKECTDQMALAFDNIIQNEKFEKIVLSGLWTENDLPSLVDTVAFLEQHTNEVIVLGPIITYSMSLPRLLAVHNTNEEIAKYNQYGTIQKIDKLYKESLSTTSAKYISILNTICPSKETCLTVTKADIPVQSDYGHLTHFGGIFILKKLLETDL